MTYDYRDKMEPAVALMAQGVSDEQTALISIAVSLKRIADQLESCSTRALNGDNVWNVR